MIAIFNINLAITLRGAFAVLEREKQGRNLVKFGKPADHPFCRQILIRLPQGFLFESGSAGFEGLAGVLLYRTFFLPPSQLPTTLASSFTFSLGTISSE